MAKLKFIFMKFEPPEHLPGKCSRDTLLSSERAGHAGWRAGRSRLNNTPAPLDKSTLSAVTNTAQAGLSQLIKQGGCTIGLHEIANCKI